MLVKLGWSDGGQSELRATNADRKALLGLLDVAKDEGRLDTDQHAGRADRVHSAKTRGDLTVLAADLPNQRGVREWIDKARIRGDDRERSTRCLAEATEQGRLAAAEHDARAAALSDAVTYAEVKSLLWGVPGWPGADEKALLAGTADRAGALTQLAQAVTDGRVHPSEHPVLQADIGQARLVSDLQELLAGIAARVSDRERENIARELEAAYREGQLDDEERAVRIGRAQEAATGADLTTLVKDLTGGGRLLARADREKIAARFAEARDDGRLDPAEYDSRLQAATAAATVAEAALLFADLIVAPRPAWRGPLDKIFDWLILNSALLPAPRHWWQRLYPKPTWKLLSTATLLAWAYPTVKFPILLGLTVGAGWIPAAGLFACYGWLARAGAGNIGARQRAVLDDLRSALQRDHPGVAAEIKHEGGTATVSLEKKRGNIPAGMPEAAVRLVWGSRLYPLKRIQIKAGPDDTTVVLNRAERAKLRHQYGPRPYGRLPKEDRAPWD